MTAEIAIMNKEAIAIAADSAVTLREERGEKILTSANKIFRLSKYHPVSAMIYGSANFMEVPWESIIKIYRSKLGKKGFNALEEYADDFINFLGKRKQLFPESQQEKYFEGNVYGYFSLIRDEIEQEVEKTVIEKEGISDEEIKEVTSKTIGTHYGRWKKADFLPSIPKNHIEELKSKYGTKIDATKKEVFQKLPITNLLSEQLTEIGASLFAKSPEGLVPPNISGVVIAGFGATDTFPSLKSFLIEGIVNNWLKYKQHKYWEITFENSAMIVPFAQSEMVATFMEGVEPSYEEAVESDLSQIFEHYPEVIVDNIEKLDTSEKQHLKKKLKEIGSKMLDQYKERLKSYRRKKYIQPVMGSCCCTA